MNYRVASRALAALFISALFAFAFAQDSRVEQNERFARVEITGAHDGQRFASGAYVRVRNATMTDAFIAGGEVVFERVEADDVFAAGGSLRYRDITLNDLVTAGGEIALEAEILDDLIGAGGRIRVDRKTKIGGDVVIAGGDLQLEGSIRGNVTAAGGRVVLSGIVGGDVEVAAGELVVEPGARISGRLVYRSDEPARIAPESVISGGVEHKPSPGPQFSVWAGVGIGLAVVLIATLGAILLGVVLQAAMPRPFHAALLSLRAHPWTSWLLGFALLVAAPVAANIILATLVGIPFGLFLYAVYAVGLALGGVTAAYWFGSLFSRRAEGTPIYPPTSAQVLRTALGMLLLVLIGLIPLIGWLLVLIAVPLGAGAFVAATWRNMRHLEPQAT